MKKIKEIEAGNLYIFQGRSSARSSMFRNLDETKYFLELANRRFAGYLKINDYVLTEESWTMLCQVEKAETIFKTYQEARDRSKKAKRECELTEIWKIVSEQFRHFLSQFVKYINRIESRTGVLVHSSFERYFFEDYAEATDFIVKMKRQEYENCQENARYRSNRALWKVKTRGKNKNCRKDGHVYLCCREVERCVGLFLGGCMDLLGLSSNDVLRQLVESTKNTHLKSSIALPYPKKE